MFANGLIAAMEEIENQTPVDQEEAAQVAVDVADESAEVQKDTDEVGTTVAQVADAVQAGEELESIADVATDAVEDGEGLTEESAEMASIAIESIRNRLGFRASTRLVPATESFGNTNTRLMSTKLVIEGIGDTLKKIWAAIKAAALRLWDKIRSFFAKIFNSAAMLQKYIKSLADRARKLPSGLKTKEKTIKHSGLASDFNFEGKADLKTAMEVVANTEKMASAAAEIGAKQRDLALEAAKLADKMDAAGIEAFVKSTNGGVQKVIDAAKVFQTVKSHVGGLAKEGAKNDEKTTYFTYGPFVGSKDLQVAMVDKKLLGQDVKAASFTFVTSATKAGETIEALEQNQLGEVLAKAEALAGKVADIKKLEGVYADITKATTKLADTVMNSADKVLDKAEAKNDVTGALSEMKTCVNNSLKTMASFGQQSPALIFQTAKALADYASVSMRNLKAAE